MRSYSRVAGSVVAVFVASVVVAQQPGHQKPGSGTPCVWRLLQDPSQAGAPASPGLDSEGAKGICVCCDAGFRCRLRSAPLQGNAPRRTLVL
jgi:hypothetical protein